MDASAARRRARQNAGASWPEYGSLPSYQPGADDQLTWIRTGLVWRHARLNDSNTCSVND